jgi:vacuolar-type H+-ATPase subunit C/Vma6
MLESVMPEKLRRIVMAMKEKFEVNDIKEAINRLKQGEAVGELDFVANSNVKLKLEAASDLASFSTALEGTPYGEIVTNSPAPAINTELDRLYIERVLQVIDECKDQKAAAPFKEYWRRVIDLANIRVVLRQVAEGTEGARLVEGGYLSAEKLTGVSDKTQLQEALQESPYAEIQTDQAGVKMEQAFLEFISKEGSRVNAKFPLKGGPIVKFLIQKELEIRNVNILLKLKAENFTGEQINEYLVI